MNDEFDEEYYLTVKQHEQQINDAKSNLSKYRMQYLENLYQSYEEEHADKPESVVKSWLNSIWELCQYGGRGYRFVVSKIDYMQEPPQTVSSAMSAIHLGCDCHMWPSKWNVKSEHGQIFTSSITDKVRRAFRALGLKIQLSRDDYFHIMND
jgi:hypothetical protein